MDSYEKKYKEALEKARNCYQGGLTCLENIFPELTWSEDERIRKELIETIHLAYDWGFSLNKEQHDNYIAWIEKQCEQKSIEPTDLRTWKYIVDAVLTEREGIGQYIDSPWTTEIAEKLQKRFGNIGQKPVFPKFRVGDTIQSCFNKQAIDKIIRIDDDLYILSSGSYVRIEFQDNWKLVEQKPAVVPKFRVGDKVKKGYLTFTVEDIGEDSYKLQAYSKDGDKGSTVFLTIGHEDGYELVEQKPVETVDYNSFDDFRKSDGEVNPSEFDSRLNELLKQFESLPKEELIGSLAFYLNVVLNDGTYKEQKPTWSEEDENIRLRLIDYLYGKSRLAKDREDGISWLKSLKDRILPQLKQEWSEEDEKMLDVIITDVNYSQKHFLDSKVIDYNKKTDWLKSLRPQSHWKPSEEQMKMLAKFIDNFDIGRNGKEILKSLYSDLEKL